MSKRKHKEAKMTMCPEVNNGNNNQVFGNVILARRYTYPNLGATFDVVLHDMGEDKGYNGFSVKIGSADDNSSENAMRNQRWIINLSAHEDFANKIKQYLLIALNAIFTDKEFIGHFEDISSKCLAASIVSSNIYNGIIKWYESLKNGKSGHEED